MIVIESNSFEKVKNFETTKAIQYPIKGMVTLSKARVATSKYKHI